MVTVSGEVVIHHTINAQQQTQHLWRLSSTGWSCLSKSLCAVKLHSHLAVVMLLTASSQSNFIA